LDVKNLLTNTQRKVRILIFEFPLANNACRYTFRTGNDAWERKVKLSIQNIELKSQVANEHVNLFSRFLISSKQTTAGGESLPSWRTHLTLLRSLRFFETNIRIKPTLEHTKC